MADAKKADTMIDTAVLPEPFFGRTDAPVVVLLLNPGLSARDREHHKNPAYREALRAELHDGRPTRHFHLVDRTEGPGHQWWRRACRELIEDAGHDRVAERLLSIEFLPYHSRRFGQARLRLPSQAYAFQLVRQALRCHAEIVCMRGLRLWAGAVPELAGYRKLVEPNSKQQAALTRGNLPHYQRIFNALRAR